MRSQKFHRNSSGGSDQSKGNVLNNQGQIGDIESYITDKSQIAEEKELSKKNRNRNRWRVALIILIFAQFILVGWQIFNQN